MGDERISFSTHSTLYLVEERSEGQRRVTMGIVLVYVAQIALLAAPVSFGLLWLLVGLALASGVGGALLGIAMVGRFVGRRVLIRRAFALLDEMPNRRPDGDGRG